MSNYSTCRCPRVLRTSEITFFTTVTRWNSCIWRTAYARIAGYFEAETGQRLAAGIKILAKALVTYHELYGFSLQITDIDPSYTLGDMERQRQITIERLQREGVWDINRENPLPQVVLRIAIVSSLQAAG